MGTLPIIGKSQEKPVHRYLCIYLMQELGTCPMYVVSILARNYYQEAIMIHTRKLSSSKRTCESDCMIENIGTRVTGSVDQVIKLVTPKKKYSTGFVKTSWNIDNYLKSPADRLCLRKIHDVIDPLWNILPLRQCTDNLQAEVTYDDYDKQSDCATYDRRYQCCVPGNYMCH